MVKTNPLRMSPDKIRIACHRGHSAGAPENTLAAFRNAHKIAGRGVVCECDLLITGDGELVLIHDDTVDRTTNGYGFVGNMAYEEIAKLDAGAWYDDTFAGERIPLLRDALLLAQELGIIYQVEFKVYDKDDVIFPKIRSLVDELGCADVIQFSSFDFVQIRSLKQAFPEIPTIGHTHSRLIDIVAIAREANVDAINLEMPHFPSGEARQLHEAGFAVSLYIPHGEQVARLKTYGVDIEGRIIQWLREGLVDQLLGDDAVQVTKLVNEARRDI